MLKKQTKSQKITDADKRKVKNALFKATLMSQDKLADLIAEKYLLLSKEQHILKSGVFKDNSDKDLMWFEAAVERFIENDSLKQHPECLELVVLKDNNQQKFIRILEKSPRGTIYLEG